MADVTVTAASVLASANAKIRSGTAGGTITAGQPLYIDTGDSNKLKAADADLSALGATVAGIALHGASSGQPIKYAIEDPSFTCGFTAAVGEIYCLSDTAGGIKPEADLLSGDYPVILGVGISTTAIALKIVQGTVAIT